MTTTQGPSNPDVLARARPLLRLAPGTALPPVADGILDLLDPAFAPTATQRSLDTVATAWLYDVMRDRIVRWIGMPAFANEVHAVVERLGLAAGDVVLDLACGHGNFTAEFARRVGPTGLVVGLDIASSMLARAAARVQRERLDNVLLVRGDALALPFADAAFAKLNCSGGLHQMPDLARALAELARVAKPGARLAASGLARTGADEDGVRDWLRRRFALHFVPVARLAQAIEHAGFEQVETRMAGAWFAYASARRRLDP
ncbi:MAG: methyltransferase protein [Deltaproteobacteria bacterium]|nr:methyltransferase protein [Deltaproteobacteria bacterium]